MIPVTCEWLIFLVNRFGYARVEFHDGQPITDGVMGTSMRSRVSFAIQFIIKSVVKFPVCCALLGEDT